MKICKECIQLDTRPGIYFVNGIFEDILWILKKEPNLMNINQNTSIEDNF